MIITLNACLLSGPDVDSVDLQELNPAVYLQQDAQETQSSALHWEHSGPPAGVNMQPWTFGGNKAGGADTQATKTHWPAAEQRQIFSGGN